MAVVVKSVKTFREGLVALGAEVALMSVGHLAMLVSFRMSAEPIFHSLMAKACIIQFQHFRLTDQGTHQFLHPLHEFGMLEF